ncbi:acetyltransferase, GNAT family [Bacteriovorax sp. Seq25_V]|nr:acetyltransferase, GNAT family [Bacteriovorax sp. Seq25_V]
MPMQEKVITLKSNIEVVLRELLPSDKSYLAEGMKKLSIETIQHRFFVAKKGFTDLELQRLTEYDHESHFAIAAISHPEQDEGLGVARFNIDEDDKRSAEFGLLIIDKMQGKGLGKTMLLALIEEAKSRGVTRLYGQLKSTNQAMINLSHSLEGVGVKLLQEGQGILNLQLLL